MRSLMVTSVVASTILLVGCSPEVVDCPAVMYGSLATITLSEPRPDLTLELCGGEGCTPYPVGTPPPSGEISQPSNAYFDFVQGDSSTGWTASAVGASQTFGYRLVDVAGVFTSEGSVDVEWIRIDGTEECGGNQRATVELPT